MCYGVSLCWQIIANNCKVIAAVIGFFKCILLFWTTDICQGFFISRGRTRSPPFVKLIWGIYTYFMGHTSLTNWRWSWYPDLRVYHILIPGIMHIKFRLFMKNPFSVFKNIRKLRCLICCHQKKYLDKEDGLGQMWGEKLWNFPIQIISSFHIFQNRSVIFG